MKAALLLCVLAGHALAAQPVLVRVTPQTLADLQARDPMIRLVKPAAGEADVSAIVSESIIKQSTILHDGKNWTLVPKDAVVFLPESMKSKVNVRPVGTLLPWKEFLTTNQSWVSTHEVSFDQAAGMEELPANSANSWSKQKKVVIAVHHGGPISVRLDNHLQSLTQR